jgi:uncharacterized protein (DUF305 family)
MSDRSRQPYLLAAAVLAVAIAVALGLVVGYHLHDDSDPVLPAEDSVDAGFARDMQIHHSQAVEMSMIVRDNTDDQTIRTIAYDIALTQRQQMGQMFAWLQLWGLPQYSSVPAMAWMDGETGGHDTAHGDEPTTPVAAQLMPGMATPEQMDQLRAARDEAAEILFLQLMIRHHEGGVDMARYAAEHAEVAEVRALAEDLVVSQEVEINMMKSMLAKRGAEPLE